MLSIITQLNIFSEVKPKHLKYVFFVGEVFPIKYLKQWMEALPDLEYVNLFGSSEVAGIFCYHRIRSLGDEMSVLPIGKPMPNCRVYLVNNGKLIEAAEQSGEIYVESEAVATCYFKNAEETDKKFFYTRQINGVNSRFFATGDIAMYDANGDIVFVSRKDFQIKRMGHRIELGEIEACAEKNPCIARACCIYNSEKKQIIVFCELLLEISSKDIKTYLKDNLADYMWPNKVKIVKKIPLNANGKKDREKLKELLEEK